jgi:hypothetical protein
VVLRALIIYRLSTMGFLLLFPLYGFAVTLGWRRRLQDELRRLEGEEIVR